jgi:hypothetical protein
VTLGKILFSFYTEVLKYFILTLGGLPKKIRTVSAVWYKKHFGNPATEEDIKKGKAIPVTDRRGPQCFETSRLPHFLENRLTDGGEVVTLTRRPPFTPQENFWFSFLLKTKSNPGPQYGWN